MVNVQPSAHDEKLAAPESIVMRYESTATGYDIKPPTH